MWTWQESYAHPAAADFDADGDVDLYFTTVYEGDTSRLFQNDGAWKFRDVTRVAELEGRVVHLGEMTHMVNQTLAYHALLFSQISSVLLTLQTDVAGLKADVAGLKKEMAEVKATLAQILTLLVQQGAVIRGFAERQPE